MSGVTGIDPPVVLVTGASGSIGTETMECVVGRGALAVTADRQPLPPGIGANGEPRADGGPAR